MIAVDANFASVKQGTVFELTRKIFQGANFAAGTIFFFSFAVSLARSLTKKLCSCHFSQC